MQEREREGGCLAQRSGVLCSEAHFASDSRLPLSCKQVEVLHSSSSNSSNTIDQQAPSPSRSLPLS